MSMGKIEELVNKKLIDRILHPKKGELIQIGNINQVVYQEFMNHNCGYWGENANAGAIGGAITYEFTPTSLSTIVKLRCACGKIEDITDYEGF